jgi:hypothetical protein
MEFPQAPTGLCNNRVNDPANSELAVCELHGNLQERANDLQLAVTGRAEDDRALEAGVVTVLLKLSVSNKRNYRTKGGLIPALCSMHKLLRRPNAH